MSDAQNKANTPGPAAQVQPLVRHLEAINNLLKYWEEEREERSERNWACTHRLIRLIKLELEMRKV